MYIYLVYWAEVKYYATKWQVAHSISDGVFGIFSYI